MRCPDCGKILPDDASFCRKCGAKLEMGSRRIAPDQNLNRVIGPEQRPTTESGFPRMGILIGLAVTGLVLAGTIAYFLFHNREEGKPENRVSEQKEQSVEPAETTQQSSEDIGYGITIREPASKVTEEEKKEVTEEEKATEEKEEEEGSVPEASENIPIVSNAYICGAYASSELAEHQYGLFHGAENVLDGNTHTAWSEGVSGVGTGETLTLELDQDCMINGLQLLIGLQENEDLYYKNARPSQIEVILSDGYSETFTLRDEMGWQTIHFSEQRKTDHVTIAIRNVFYGNSYEDTLITEIQLF